MTSESKQKGPAETPAPFAWRMGVLALVHAIGMPAAAQAVLPDPTRTCVWSSAQPMLDAIIAGQPVRLRLDFDAHAPVTLSPAAALRLQLASTERPGTTEKPDRGVVVSRVGRKTVRIPWSEEQVEVAGVVQPLEVLTPPAYSAGAGDGTIRPSVLPCATVRLEQRPVRPTDVETVMRILEDGRFGGLRVQATVGGKDVQVEFGPWRRDTVGTAATGGLLVTVLGGSLTGPVVETPVVHDVTRPARLLRLDRPWLVAGVKVPALMMRVSDWEGNSAVPPDADLEADLIQVARRRNPQRSIRLIYLGQDVLRDCASFEWRRAGNLLAVRCPAP